MEEGDFAWYLQGNRVAEENPKPYRILWAADRFEGNVGAGSGAGFVQNLKEGDELLIWARAKVTYPNNIFYKSEAYLHAVGWMDVRSQKSYNNSTIRLLNNEIYARHEPKQGLMYGLALTIPRQRI